MQTSLKRFFLFFCLFEDILQILFVKKIFDFIKYQQAELLLLSNKKTSN